ncbi:MAG TPA: hypothetical protein PLZ77_01330 [Lachnospiraceae bacterium]|nr:hypothetical protein [Lachnospiraceae bacterium]HPF28726.1 hypothetical protein [Lachnospiraceae bacterium]
MIYMHYCSKCKFLHMLSGHRTDCPGCGGTITELKIKYSDYLDMNLKEREDFLKKCQSPDSLQEITYVYKKHKFSKWYKKGGKRG